MCFVSLEGQQEASCWLGLGVLISARIYMGCVWIFLRIIPKRTFRWAANTVSNSIIIPSIKPIPKVSDEWY